MPFRCALLCLGDEDGLTVTGAENSLWSAVMIGILPAALIALGIVICIRRKRR